MKAVLMSIRPLWCELIANGQKTIEVRKRRPKLKTPFKCYIYCTNSAPWLVRGDTFRGDWVTEYCTTYGYSREEAERIWGVMNGKVIGEFVCDRIERFVKVGFTGSHEAEKYHSIDDDYFLHDIPLSKMQMTYEQLFEYARLQELFGLHISNLEIYEEPKDLSEFYVWKKCNSCRVTGYESTACGYDEDCKVPAMITRPPQSWCYVEETT